MKKNYGIMRVCAYARVSSDSEDQKNSFLAQVDFYTKYINDNPNWDYIDIYADRKNVGKKKL